MAGHLMTDNLTENKFREAKCLAINMYKECNKLPNTSAYSIDVHNPPVPKKEYKIKKDVKASY